MQTRAATLNVPLLRGLRSCPSNLKLEYGEPLMVQINEQASAELRRLLTNSFARPWQGVRLRLNEAGGLAMTIDVPHSGDSIIRRENLPVLIVDARLATRLAQRVLDFPAASGRGFALGWRIPASKSTRAEPG